ncbi:MAG: four helix bundle protein [Bacteroidaceae bacterium]|nr:four helix bundle protein [Bacteroidaceae bacterium]
MEKGNNVIQEKSEAFALRIINLYKLLRDDRRAYIIPKQLLRSGTSIGANVCEALCAISRKDFLSKMYISFKECNETLYWLRLLYKSELLTQKEFESIYTDGKEIYHLLSSITKTTSAKM